MIILIIYSFIIGMSYQAKKNDRFYFFRKSFLDSSQNFSEIPQISETIPRCLSQLNEKYLPLVGICPSPFQTLHSNFVARWIVDTKVSTQVRKLNVGRFDQKFSRIEVKFPKFPICNDFVKLNSQRKWNVTAFPSNFRSELPTFQLLLVY